VVLGGRLVFCGRFRDSFVGHYRVLAPNHESFGELFGVRAIGYGYLGKSFVISLLGRQFAGGASVVVSIVCSITQIGLCVLAIWSMAKAMGEATQKDINAKLGRKVSAASESGKLVQ
jgi:hypothetical protein